MRQLNVIEPLEQKWSGVLVVYPLYGGGYSHALCWIPDVSDRMGITGNFGALTSNENEPERFQLPFHRRERGIQFQRASLWWI